MREHRPAALIHLGDIYYSGTPSECAANYTDVITAVFDETLGPGKRIPVFTLAGNHDYYALGYGFYKMFEAINDAIVGAAQEASYFCLRTADAGWQFLAMDTGHGDSNPADEVNPDFSGPRLAPTEVQWLHNKLNTFSGATILLSHHQLFSAHQRLNGMLSEHRDLPYLNPYLRETFAPYFTTDVAGWLWGHEHNFAAYENGLFGLAKGRLVGCSAYEELASSDPYEIAFPQVPYLDPTAHRLGCEGGYYNHGYAVIDFSKRTAPAGAVPIAYYQYPSWGDEAPQTPSASVVLTEELARPVAPPAAPATYATTVTMLAQEGVYIAAEYTNMRYYPTTSTDAPIGVQIAGGDGPIRHGDTAQIMTTEPTVGAYNVLGAWSTPALYYATTGHPPAGLADRQGRSGRPGRRLRRPGRVGQPRLLGPVPAALLEPPARHRVPDHGRRRAVLLDAGAGLSRYISSGAATPSRSRQRAIVRCAATHSARRKRHRRPRARRRRGSRGRTP